ncbi:MAG: hypothetical protein R3F17_14255 [Planctomycetota bacterium]
MRFMAGLSGLAMTGLFLLLAIQGIALVQPGADLGLLAAFGVAALSCLVLASGLFALAAGGRNR